MTFRLQSLFVAAAVVFAGSMLAQAPTVPSSQTPSGSQQPTTTPGTPNATAPGFPGATPEATTMDPYASDKRFVNEAAENARVEVELSKLAQAKGSTDAVKEFGKRVVEEHTKTTQNLTQVAAVANIDVPSGTPRKAKKGQEKLSKLDGADFDRAYAKMMLDEIKDDVKSFDRESRNGKVPQIKDFASKTLPTLQEHRKTAEQLVASATGKTGPEVSNR